jgi:hypothetical protein
MGIEPTERASQHVPPVLKTGPVTRSGRATARECNGFRGDGGRKIGQRNRSVSILAGITTIGSDGEGRGTGDHRRRVAAVPCATPSLPRILRLRFRVGPPFRRAASARVQRSRASSERRHVHAPPWDPLPGQHLLERETAAKCPSGAPATIWSRAAKWSTKPRTRFQSGKSCSLPLGRLSNGARRGSHVPRRANSERCPPETGRRRQTSRSNEHYTPRSRTDLSPKRAMISSSPTCFLPSSRYCAQTMAVLTRPEQLQASVHARV